ncbi:4-coumarate--CoA ligase 9-like protein, partial [Tanacetum coccineum]
MYLSLFAAGVTVSPANPVSSVHEVERMMKLCKACVVFATSDCVHKVVEAGFKGNVVVIDSVEFENMMRLDKSIENLTKIQVSQDDIAAILYSS